MDEQQRLDNSKIELKTLKLKYALSIKQPWGFLICAGYKDIENRDWKIGRNPRHGPYSSRDVDNFSIPLPSRIYVHAGKTMDLTAGEFIAERLNRLQALELANAIRTGLSLGAIIGEVDITGCVTVSKSPWFVGKYGFVLSHPVLYDKPIPCRGQLGFFEPDIEVRKIK